MNPPVRLKPTDSAAAAGPEHTNRTSASGPGPHPPAHTPAPAPPGNRADKEARRRTTEIHQPDLVAVKSRQRQTWASGDYAAVASRIVLMAERLADAADLRAGERVLDVACGSGNAALAAARCGCEVTGIDYVPELLDRGRERAAAEGLSVDFAEGDAEALQFPDGAFDAVLSCVGGDVHPRPGAGRGRAG